MASRLMGLAFVVLVWGSCLGLATDVRAEEKSPPNVLFLAIDDLNDWTGFLGGNPESHTPNLDRLAARGTVFTRAYCAAPACNPSRVALLVGQRPSSTGVYTNSQPFRPVLPDAITLPQHFMAHGYDVLGCGKIYHGSFPDKQSWHDYFNRPKDPVPAKRPANGIANTSQFDWGPVKESDAEMGDAHVVDWAIERMNQKRDKPLFLAVGLYRPHLPWYVPQEYFDQFPADKVTLPEVPDDDLDDLPEYAIKRMARPDGDHRKVTESNNWHNAVQGYLASIAFTDRQVGRLMDAFDKSPLAKNTIIVMWGDHGWHLGEKKHWRKFTLWEEATRVPLLISAPGLTEPGVRCERTASLLDLYPTLCELCDLPVREELEGDSLKSLLANPQAKWDRPAITTHYRNNHGIRTEKYRYIRYTDGSEELYDHQADPMEHKNLASDPAYTKVKQQLAQWLPKKNAPDAPSEKDKKDK